MNRCINVQLFPDQQWLSGDIQPNLVTGHPHSVIQYHSSVGARLMYFIMVILSTGKQTTKKKKKEKSPVFFGTDKIQKLNYKVLYKEKSKPNNLT